MHFQADVETQIGAIRAIWDGGQYVQVFETDTEQVSDLIDVQDGESGELMIGQNAEALARLLVEWVWEHERGIAILSVLASEVSRIDLDSIDSDS